MRASEHKVDEKVVELQFRPTTRELILRGRGGCPSGSAGLEQVNVTYDVRYF